MNKHCNKLICLNNLILLIVTLKLFISGLLGFLQNHIALVLGGMFVTIFWEVCQGTWICSKSIVCFLFILTCVICFKFHENRITGAELYASLMNLNTIQYIEGEVAEWSHPQPKSLVWKPYEKESYKFESWC